MAMHAVTQGITGLKRAGWTCVDMHVHSHFSPDSVAKVDDILTVAGRQGIGIALTDHNEIKGALIAEKLKKEVLVIPGVEVCTGEGIDVLVYFSSGSILNKFYTDVVVPNMRKDRFRTSRLPARDLAHSVSKYGGVSCLAHPYRMVSVRSYWYILHKRRIRKIREAVPFVEVVNGKNFFLLNRWAEALAIKMDKGFLGGSDSHKARSVGHVLTCVQLQKGGPKEFLDALRRKTDMLILCPGGAVL
jgi:predicted metal-dependent phosphoesterase TrpH